MKKDADPKKCQNEVNDLVVDSVMRMLNNIVPAKNDFVSTEKTKSYL